MFKSYKITDAVMANDKMKVQLKIVKILSGSERSKGCFGKPEEIASCR